MTPYLLDPFRHNAWATQELLACCRDCSSEDLAASVPGTFGSIIATFNHFLNSEAGYHFRITGHQPSWDRQADDSSDIPVLEARAAELAVFWDTLLRDPVDVDHTVTVYGDEGEAFTVAVGVIIAQVLNHGNEHRAQICTMLGATGRQPPDLGAWEYGLASGRMTPTPAE